MITEEKKTVRTFINGVQIQVEILQCGKSWWLKEIEQFVTNSEEKFFAITQCKQELRTPLYFQRALQAFINHIQMGGEEQKANLIRNHFRNWINSQNGSLIKIISGNGESKQSVRNEVQNEFDRRNAIRQSARN